MVENIEHEKIQLITPWASQRMGLGKKGSEWNRAGFGQGSGRGVILLNVVKHGIGTELI